MKNTQEIMIAVAIVVVALLLYDKWLRGMF